MRSREISMPPLGPNCEECSSFEKGCSVAMGMKAIGTLVNEVNEGKPMAPWARKSLRTIGISTSGIKPGSTAELVSTASSECAGPIDLVTPETSIPKLPNSRTYAGADIRRRPLSERNNPEAKPTVRIDTTAGGVIRDLDTAKGAAELTKFGDYVEVFPERHQDVSPYGRPDQETLYYARDNQMVLDATKQVKDAAATSFDHLLTPADLERHAETIEDEAMKTNKNGWYVHDASQRTAMKEKAKALKS